MKACTAGHGGAEFGERPQRAMLLRVPCRVSGRSRGLGQDDRYRSLSKGCIRSSVGMWTLSDSEHCPARNRAAACRFGRGSCGESGNPAFLVDCSLNWDRIESVLFEGSEGRIQAVRGASCWRTPPTCPSRRSLGGRGPAVLWSAEQDRQRPGGGVRGLCEPVAALGMGCMAEVPADTRPWLERPPTVARVNTAQLDGEAWTRRHAREGSRGPRYADFPIQWVVSRPTVGCRDPRPGSDRTKVVPLPCASPGACRPGRLLLSLDDYEGCGWLGSWTACRVAWPARLPVPTNSHPDFSLQGHSGAGLRHLYPSTPTWHVAPVGQGTGTEVHDEGSCWFWSKETRGRNPSSLSTP